MFNALPRLRVATCLAALSLATVLAPVASSQTIDLSLNVFYNSPSNVNSGGTWELVGKSGAGDFGISSMNVTLTNIVTTPGAITNQAPRGTVNGSDTAGFIVELLANELSIRQEPLFPTGGETEGAFYRVGRVQNGVPNATGPVYPSLTDLQDVPWATGDDFGQAAWNIAASFASGTFLEGTTPAFLPGSTGLVFSSVGTSTTYGGVMFAPITTIVRTNFAPSGLADYNGNGVVDAADYVVWRKGHIDADGSGNGTVGPEDYDKWVEEFAEVAAGAGGGGLSSGSVPEPASAALVIFTLLCGAFTRRRRA